MDCPRCCGPLVAERFVDLLDDSGQMRVNLWRCLNCGYVCDPVILANQARRPEITSHGRAVPKRRGGKAG